MLGTLNFGKPPQLKNVNDGMPKKTPKMMLSGKFQKSGSLKWIRVKSSEVMPRTSGTLLSYVHAKASSHTGKDADSPATKFLPVSDKATYVVCANQAMRLCLMSESETYR